MCSWSVSMNIDTYSDRLRGFVQSAQGNALAADHQQFAPEHLLKVLLDDTEGLAASLIKSAGGDVGRVKLANDAALAALPKVTGGSGQLYIAPALAKVFKQAEDNASKASDSFVTVERVLQALAMVKTATTSKSLSHGGFGELGRQF